MLHKTVILESLYCELEAPARPTVRAHEHLETLDSAHELLELGLAVHVAVALVHNSLLLLVLLGVRCEQWRLVLVVIVCAFWCWWRRHVLFLELPLGGNVPSARTGAWSAHPARTPTQRRKRVRPPSQSAQAHCSTAATENQSTANQTLTPQQRICIALLGADVPEESDAALRCRDMVQHCDGQRSVERSGAQRHLEHITAKEVVVPISHRIPTHTRQLSTKPV